MSKSVMCNYRVTNGQAGRYAQSRVYNSPVTKEAKFFCFLLEPVSLHWSSYTSHAFRDTHTCV